MGIFINSNGTKKINGIFTNLNDSKKSISSVWGNNNEVATKLFSKSGIADVPTMIFINREYVYQVNLNEENVPYGFSKISTISANDEIVAECSYGGGIFFANIRFHGAEIYYSKDAINWNKSVFTGLGTYDYHHSFMVYGNKLFVMAFCHKNGNMSTTNKIYESFNGKDWNAVSFPSKGTLPCILDGAYGNGTHVFLFQQGKSNYTSYGIYRKENGEWDYNTIGAKFYTRIKFGGGYFLAVDSTFSSISYSSDGISFRQLEINNAELTDVHGITYGNNKFLISGYSKYLKEDGTYENCCGIAEAYISENNVWNVKNIYKTKSRYDNLSSLNYGYGYFTMFLNNKLNYSIDGTVWTQVNDTIQRAYSQVSAYNIDSNGTISPHN